MTTRRRGRLAGFPLPGMQAGRRNARSGDCFLILFPGEGIEHPGADRDVLPLQVHIVVDLSMAEVAHAAGDHGAVPIASGTIERKRGVWRVEHADGVCASFDVDGAGACIEDLQH